MNRDLVRKALGCIKVKKAACPDPECPYMQYRICQETKILTDAEELLSRSCSNCKYLAHDTDWDLCKMSTRVVYPEFCCEFWRERE